MQKNYYFILGVSSTATLEEIKSAFRRRAMELHPDHSGIESGPFLEIQEAYKVLSDPERRRSYDRDSHSIVRRRPWGPSPEPLMPRRSQAEPFRQTEHETSGREFSVGESFDIYRPSSEELFERLWSNFQDWPRPKVERFENLTIEAVLTPDEASSGGRIQLRIPGLATCPTCGGHGATGLSECWRCRGAGELATDYPLEIQFPAGVKDGYSVSVALSRFGIENLYLIVLFRVCGAERGIDEL
jgi:molecular chaperone DnaJ